MLFEGRLIGSGITVITGKGSGGQMHKMLVDECDRYSLNIGYFPTNEGRFYLSKNELRHLAYRRGGELVAAEKGTWSRSNSSSSSSSTSHRRRGSSSSSRGEERRGRRSGRKAAAVVVGGNNNVRKQ